MFSEIIAIVVAIVIMAVLKVIYDFSKARSANEEIAELQADMLARDKAAKMVSSDPVDVLAPKCRETFVKSLKNLTNKDFKESVRMLMAFLKQGSESAIYKENYKTYRAMFTLCSAQGVLVNYMRNPKAVEAASNEFLA